MNKGRWLPRPWDSWFENNFIDALYWKEILFSPDQNTNDIFLHFPWDVMRVNWRRCHFWRRRLWRLVRLVGKKSPSALVKRNWWQIVSQKKQKFVKCGWGPFEMKFTVFCVWWLIDFMLPRVLSVLQLANNPQMYWRYDNMIIQLRDSEKKLLQNKQAL